MLQPDESLADRVSQDAFSAAAGIRFEVVRPGCVISRLTIDARHRNPLGVVHGAVPYTMADTAMGLALATTLGPDGRCATLAASIQYLAPVREGELVADTVIVHRGDKVAALRSDVRTGDGLLCAVVTGSFYISQPDAPRS